MTALDHMLDPNYTPSICDQILDLHHLNQILTATGQTLKDVLDASHTKTYEASKNSTVGPHVPLSEHHLESDDFDVWVTPRPNQALSSQMHKYRVCYGETYLDEQGRECTTIQRPPGESGFTDFTVYELTWHSADRFTASQIDIRWAVDDVPIRKNAPAVVIAHGVDHTRGERPQLTGVCHMEFHDDGFPSLSVALSPSGRGSSHGFHEYCERTGIDPDVFQPLDEEFIADPIDAMVFLADLRAGLI